MHGDLEHGDVPVWLGVAMVAAMVMALMVIGSYLHTVTGEPRKIGTKLAYSTLQDKKK